MAATELESLKAEFKIGKVRASQSVYETRESIRLCTCFSVQLNDVGDFAHHAESDDIASAELFKSAPFREELARSQLRRLAYKLHVTADLFNAALAPVQP